MLELFPHAQVNGVSLRQAGKFLLVLASVVGCTRKLPNFNFLVESVYDWLLWITPFLFKCFLSLQGPLFPSVSTSDNDPDFRVCKQHIHSFIIHGILWTRASPKPFQEILLRVKDKELTVPILRCLFSQMHPACVC